MSAGSGNKKKSGGGGFAALIFILIVIISNLSKNRELMFRLRVFFHRLGAGIPYDTQRKLLMAAPIAVVVLIWAIAAAARAAKRKKADFVPRGAQHSHDRAQGYRGDESAQEHWKKQLDGFLESGIIDRSEYRMLLQRRMK